MELFNVIAPRWNKERTQTEPGSAAATAKRLCLTTTAPSRDYRSKLILAAFLHPDCQIDRSIDRDRSIGEDKPYEITPPPHPQVCVRGQSTRKGGTSERGE